LLCAAKFKPYAHLSCSLSKLGPALIGVNALAKLEFANGVWLTDYQEDEDLGACDEIENVTDTQALRRRGSRKNACFERGRELGNTARLEL
jgi:hypothetical protein